MFHMYLNHDHNGLEVNNSKFTVNTDLHKPRMGLLCLISNQKCKPLCFKTIIVKMKCP